MDPENAISLGNIILFLGALFGVIASFSRPIRSPYGEDQKWQIWDLPLFVFFGYLWILVVVVLFSPVIGDGLTGLFVSGEEDNTQVRSIVATIIMQSGLVAVVLAAIHHQGWTFRGFFQHADISWSRAFRHTGHLFFRYLPAIWLVGLFWGGLLYALKELGYDMEVEPQVAAQWIADSDSILFLSIMGIMVVFAAPISEELVFRAFLYRFLRNRGPARLALILSSLLFALLHASLHSFLPLLFIGLLLAKIYEDTHDIRTPILFHLFFNLFSFLNLLFLP